jgi:uncharacterized membrane protein YdjX (TVP38/TMEM64 family)
MLREMIIVIFLTSLVMSFVCTFMGISDGGRMFLAVGNGLFWGRHFYIKYYVSKNDKEGDKQ